MRGGSEMRKKMRKKTAFAMLVDVEKALNSEKPMTDLCKVFHIDPTIFDTSEDFQNGITVRIADLWRCIND
jgi:hypothetical protein